MSEERRFISVRIDSETYKKLRDAKLQYMHRTKKGVNMSRIIRALIRIGLKEDIDKLIEEVENEKSEG